jgi:dTDP-D-glucose 4,6-dehydratase
MHCICVRLMSDFGTSMSAPCHIVRCLGLIVPVVPDHREHDHRYALDSGKLHASLNWTAGSPVIESLVRSVSWLRGWVMSEAGHTGESSNRTAVRWRMH